MATPYSGFSKLDRAQRIKYLVENSPLTLEAATGLPDFDANKGAEQQVISDMIENYIGNFPMPMGIVPNMLINGASFLVPFITEESSVVAAASKASKYWAARGGFHAEVSTMTKKGQVHFTWNGKSDALRKIFPEIRQKLLLATEGHTENMRRRGGGITSIQLLDKTLELTDYYQLDVSFETADAMGANFINSCLETLAAVLQLLPELNSGENRVEVIMSILSNYTPECIVKCHAVCPVGSLTEWNGELAGDAFANKFKQAVDIANLDISRAVTHNKGIMNGVDAVLFATGNDSRATAAAVHSYASRYGSYKSLTSVKLEDKLFRIELALPLAIGTVGGITGIHPVVQKALSILNHPDARTLMKITAASGLANHFAAIASLLTTGIQHGHMRLHLSNILNQLEANQEERENTLRHFAGRTVSHTAVAAYLLEIRTRP